MSISCLVQLWCDELHDIIPHHLASLQNLRHRASPSIIKHHRASHEDVTEVLLIVCKEPLEGSRTHVSA